MSFEKPRTFAQSVSKFPKEQRDALNEIWYETGVMDLYDGNIKQYFEVIAGRLRDKNKRILELETAIKTATNLLNNAKA